MAQITSRQIASLSAQAKARFGPQLEAALIRQHQQQSLELDLITQANVCPVDSLPNLQERLGEWFTQLKRIGTESTAGFAFQGDMKKEKNVFIVKTSQNPETDDLQHELFVGLFGLNQLRSTKQGLPVYNFAYIFGGFKCSPPLVSPQDKTAVAWCNNMKDTVNYVFY